MMRMRPKMMKLMKIEENEVNEENEEENNDKDANPVGVNNNDNKNDDMEE
jgi:hypothetical protein